MTSCVEKKKNTLWLKVVTYPIKMKNKHETIQFSMSIIFGGSCLWSVVGLTMQTFNQKKCVAVE